MVLFILYGVVYVLIGALTPIVQNTDAGRAVTISSEEKDGALFGGPLPDLLKASPGLAKMRSMLLNIIGGLLVAAGLMVLALAWFGLRQGQTWALATLSLAGIVVLPFWVLVFRPFAEAGISISLNFPPFMLVPALLVGPAIILGWLGMR